LNAGLRAVLFFRIFQVLHETSPWAAARRAFEKAWDSRLTAIWYMRIVSWTTRNFGGRMTAGDEAQKGGRE
jgi:hypothetical protein